MPPSEVSLAQLLSRSRTGDEPTGALDATCLAIVEELAQDSGPLLLPATLSCAFGTRRTVVVECARRIDLD